MTVEDVYVGMKILLFLCVSFIHLKNSFFCRPRNGALNVRYTALLSLAPML